MPVVLDLLLFYHERDINKIPRFPLTGEISNCRQKLKARSALSIETGITIKEAPSHADKETKHTRERMEKL